MAKLEDVTSEADFVRTYRRDLSRLTQEIRSQVRMHGYDRRKYDLVFAGPLADHYMGLSNGANIRGFRMETMLALAMLWHKEVCELRKSIGLQADDCEFIIAEYEKVKHHLDRFSDAAPDAASRDRG
jgi:hypothetical protein